MAKEARESLPRVNYYLPLQPSPPVEESVANKEGIFLGVISQKIEKITKKFLEKKTIGRFHLKIWNLRKKKERLVLKGEIFWLFKFMVEITSTDLDDLMQS